MGIGVDNLEQKIAALKDESFSRLKLQTTRLAPHFPTSEEIELAKEAAIELSSEAVDKSAKLLRRRELFQELAYDFKVVNINGIPQTVWRGLDWFPNNNGSELFVTPDGQLIKAEFVPQEEANPQVKAGWYYFNMDGMDIILNTSVRNNFILKNVKKTASRWERARNLLHTAA